jgi:hypothetical protein
VGQVSNLPEGDGRLETCPTKETQAMTPVRWYGGVLFLTAALFAAGLARAADSPEMNDARALAGRIDRLLEARWAAAGVRPTAEADDAEFLRRVTLDLTGTIPTVPEVRDFLADRTPDKRQRLVARLLASPRYVSHFSRYWRSVLLPENADVANLGLGPVFEGWLAGRLSENAGYDRIAREILTSAPRPARQEAFLALPGLDGPGAFYLANENKPENLAGSTARLFLAVKLECAQCHNHPHAAWKQEQFWEYAAFFGAGRGGNGRSIRLPKGGQLVQARFPDGTEPEWKPGAAPLPTLAEWVTRPDNPYFARATVNRVWSAFFGGGAVEPVDDLTRTGHDSLLDELAGEFVKHGYDLKYLIRAIVLSRAYQLSSAAPPGGADGAAAFARMPVRALAPEQILDALATATGIRAASPDLATRFARQDEKPTEVQTSILQALTLMNGKLVDDATVLERSETLAAVANAPFLDTAGKVEVLYLATLSRPPRPEESARLVRYVEKGGPSGDRDRALADVFWALLNSGEFILNH